MNENHQNNTNNGTPGANASKDMTQRVRLDDVGQTPARSANSQQVRKKKRWFMTKKEKITLITLISLTAVLLLLALILFSCGSSGTEDDGLILKGVWAAGVNLGGMTSEEATIALEEAVANTYTELDMVVDVLGTEITLSPQDTGAQLDIQAVVKAAYDYGRTGSRTERNQAKQNALNNSVIISITPYLNLDTDYIRGQIDLLGTQFSTTLTQPTIELTGTKPQMGVEKPDTTVIHQTLTIYVGTAEYGLDTTKLYNQIMESYNSRIFRFEHNPTVVAPDSIEDDLLSYYDQLCVEPVDAQIDPITYDVTPEIYGYGFNLDAVKEEIANAPYGTTLQIPLTYLAPNLTEELISGALFKDVIGDHSAVLGEDLAWNNNVTLACQALNGLIIKSGDTFSFNDILGELTADKGYQEASAYRGRVSTLVMGGGVTHAASLLFTCVLESELEILEYAHHTYATDFIEVGRDIYVAAGKSDFRFRNNRPDPIRIKAEVIEGTVFISIEGTDTRNYQVDIRVKTTKTVTPGKLYNIMLPTNPGGYENNDVLEEGLNGYVIELYKSMYDKQTGELINETFISTYTYDARDAVVVQLQSSSESEPS